MESNYEITLYRPSAKYQVVELLTKFLWTADSTVNTSYLEWKYERNPYQQTPLIYLAFCEGNIVGMRGMFGLKWEFGNPPKELPGLYADDFVIAPEHRNRGLVTKIMRYAMTDVSSRGFTYAFNLSAGAVTRMASLAMDWRNAGSMRVHCRQSDRFRHVRGNLKKKGLFRRLGRLVSYRPWIPKEIGFDNIVARQGRIPRKTDSHIVVERDPRPEEMEKLISGMEYDGRIRHVRDRHYLSWRFQNPHHRYLFLYWEGAELEGYMVLQEHISHRARPGINIVDWEATSPHVRAGLLQKAIALCSFTDLHIWTATLPEATTKILYDSGFRLMEETVGVTQKDRCLLVRPVRDSLLNTEWVLDGYRLLDMANWDIRMIYSMDG